MVVRDHEGRNYSLVSELGEAGGFGKVYRDSSGFAVKLFKRERAESLHGRGALGDVVRRLKRLPIGDLRVARPIGVITEPWAGYAMELVPDASTWARLTTSSYSSPEAFWEVWDQSGGMGRRLRLCFSLCDLMTDLSARGLVFADLNPNNVMSPNNLGAEPEAWLIDIDNLNYGSFEALAYPGYTAPEICRQECGATTSRTDAWSLAVLVFTVLTGCHPFESGELVSNGAVDVELEQSRRGEIPWIDDPDDSSNEAPSGVGLRRRTVLTLPLIQYFHEMFGGSRQDPSRRPPAARLARSLERALNLVIRCSACGRDMVARSQCVFCDEPTDPAVLAIQRNPFNAAERRVIEERLNDLPSSDVNWRGADHIVVGENSSIAPASRYLSFRDSSLPILRFTRHGNRIRVEREVFGDDLGIWVLGGRRSSVRLETNHEFALDKVNLRVGNEDGPHVLIRSSPRPQR